MSRREFPESVKVAAFQRCGGRCEGPDCGKKLIPGHFRYDHRIPDFMGGEPTLENCQCLCDDCDGVKTNGADIPAIAKAKRREKKLSTHPEGAGARAVYQARKESKRLHRKAGRKRWRRKINGQVEAYDGPAKMR